MLKRIPLVVAAAIVALVATALLFGTVLAGGPDPNSGRDAGIGGREVPLAVAADLTGLSEEQLLAELEGGKTIPAFLEEQGTDLSTFHQAVSAARQAAVDEAIDQGQMTGDRSQLMYQHAAQNGNCDGDGPYGPKHGAGHGEPGEEAHRHGHGR